MPAARLPTAFIVGLSGQFYKQFASHRPASNRVSELQWLSLIKPRARMDVRFAKEAEINQLAKIWYDGWQDAHATILPVQPARVRTFESFRERLQEALPNVCVVGELGRPIGFCIVKGNELYQLYVSAPARG